MDPNYYQYDQYADEGMDIEDSPSAKDSISPFQQFCQTLSPIDSGFGTVKPSPKPMPSYQATQGLPQMNPNINVEIP